MEPPEWAQVRRILYDALELTPERRSAYLDDACQGNPALRAELESLLSASENATVVDRPVLPPSKLGPYEIGAKIGEGGMGAVYKAVDTRLGRTVALKLIAGPSADWRQERRFAREAKAASSLNHPGIVTIYEFDRQDGVDFIAMEYVEGTPLNKLIEEGATPLPVLLGYMRQAAVAIGKAHAAGIVHRDLKPANLMVTAEGQVKVLDFGLAKRQRASTDPEVTQTQALTREGISVGTPAYMSPEQVLAEPEDARSDIFSFGIILYEIAAGRRPFGGTEARATLYRIVHEEPAAASLGPAVPPALASLIARCLRKNRAERPQSMDEVAAALTDITSAPSGRPGISRRALVAGGALGVAALAAGLWTLRPPARVLTYSIEAQKMRDGSPVGEPYTASPADIFEGGWRFRLRLRSPQPGFLYLVNEGPGEQGVSRLWVLYPAKVSAAPLAANQELATDWYVFDPNPGTEKLWVVWAYQAIGSMEEALRGSDHGEVTNSTSAQGLRTLLAGLAKSSSSGAPGSLQIRGTAGASAILLQLHHR